MNWSNVKLIWLREVRDQLRDRRTLFMIAVLPLLLYPLLGMVLLQVSQFYQEHTTKVLIVGMEPMAGLPPLVEKSTAADNKKEGANAENDQKSVRKDDAPQEPPKYQFDSRWARESLDPKLLELELASTDELQLSPDGAKATDEIRRRMRDKGYDVVVYFPADFSQRLKQFREDLLHHRDPSGKPAAKSLAVPTPEIYFSSVKDKSLVAYNRVSEAIRNWQDAIGEQTLRDSDVPAAAARPFSVSTTDVAEPTQRQAALWSKILPFILLIWALTGAFYPAIDLCAGEKERGTLETLLCSPAERSEIVAGKLLAIMLFSIATSLLNIASLGVTGSFVMRRISGLATIGIPSGPPPLASLGWLIVALVPASALFSALCLALAAFARSSKEGQYYLMPLILGTMPLMVLPMAPGVELTLGNSLIPLTGLILLLRQLLEGNVREALPFFPPVAIVTFVCCRVAMRWAVDQFNKEQVLFRESERWDLRLWLKHLWRDRGPTPTVGAAVMCGVLILVIEFFLDFTLPQPENFTGIALSVLVTQGVAVLIPLSILTLLLTRNRRKTLLIRRPNWLTIPAALLLAVTANPLFMKLSALIQELYKVGNTAEHEFEKIDASFRHPPHWWMPLVLLAVVPPICEELAFRGFILSGLRHVGHKWRAILISSVFFAISHQILQQSLGTFVLGILIAYMAVQSGSIWPGMVFHATHNALAWLHSLGGADLGALAKENASLAWIGTQAKKLDAWSADNPTAAWFVILFAALIAAGIVAWFARLQYLRTDEERLQETIEHEAAATLRV